MQPGGDEIALVGFDDRQMNRNHCYKLGKELMSWGKGGSGEKVVFRDSGLWLDNRTRALSRGGGKGKGNGPLEFGFQCRKGSGGREGPGGEVERKSAKGVIGSGKGIGGGGGKGSG